MYCVGRGPDLRAGGDVPRDGAAVSGEGDAAGGPHQPQVGRVGRPRDRRPGHSQVIGLLFC